MWDEIENNVKQKSWTNPETGVLKGGWGTSPCLSRDWSCGFTISSMFNYISVFLQDMFDIVRKLFKSPFCKKVFFAIIISHATPATYVT